MNIQEKKYSKFALVKEMLETSDVVKKFDPSVSERFAGMIKNKKKVFFTGEGSSRIFPAKRAMAYAMRKNLPFTFCTDGATQALEYSLDDYAVFAASNSGKTKEVIRLLTKLQKNGHQALFGLTANKDTQLEKLTCNTHVLSCGGEDAVAATKSVIEQALFYHSVCARAAGSTLNNLSAAADSIHQALTLVIEADLVKKIANSPVIYFAGRNNGAAEELALKTNEITRKKSAYLEGTYAVHGIEEVMDKKETVIIVEPFEEEVDKFSECLVKGVGMNVIALSTKKTIFPTVIIPDGGEYAEYVQLAAGWNLLVEIGLAAGIDLDKPQRARKVGNEFIG